MLTEHSEDNCKRVQDDRQDEEASTLGQLEREKFIFDLLPAPLQLPGHSHSSAHNTTLPAESVVCVLDAIWRGLPFAFGTLALQGEPCACSTPRRPPGLTGDCAHWAVSVELSLKRFDFRGSFRVESAERTPTTVLEMCPL
jgi:hypothetical protein